MGVKFGSILREEHRLKVSENRVMRRMLVPKRDIVLGDWKKELHNEELHNSYSLPNVIRNIKLRRTRLAKNVARMWIRGKHI
jgi:hypothetical protein